MEPTKEIVTERSDEVTSQTGVLPEESKSQDGGEFKIEIRRLEVPVRPRGVLAE
jgi:hypothetical protein